MITCYSGDKVTVDRRKVERERERQRVAVLYWEDCELIGTIFGTLFSFPVLASQKLGS